MFKNLKIGTKLLLRIGALVVGLLVFMGYAYWNRTQVQVDGPMYSEIVEGKDLLADLLPPPLYIVQAHLDSAEMLTAKPSELPTLVEHAKKVQGEFEARHDYWVKTLEPNRLRDVVVDDIFKPAEQWFTVFNNEFVPAVLAGDLEKARALRDGPLEAKYDEHEARILEAVRLATEQAKSNEEHAAEDIRQGNYVFFGVVAAILLLAALIASNISGGITRPLADTVGVLEAVAQGDLTQRLESTSTDEMGTLADALNRAVASMRSAVASIAENSQALAGASEELASVSTQMSSNANETSAQAGVVSAASEQVSRNVETVSTGADEMNASIKEIAKNATEAARVATAAVAAAESTNATMERLGDSSSEIGKVIRVITSIAEQTNLLALNATIEAARAGEAGKGFAVVANEVKELAKETAKATEDISQKVQAIQADTTGAVTAIADIGTIITQINDISNTIASAVEEQSATTNEIGRNVAEAAKGSAEIAQNIVGVAQAASSTNSGANDAQQAASELARMASDLQNLVGRFKYEGESVAQPRAAAKRGDTAQGRTADHWLGDPASDGSLAHGVA